MKLDPRFSMVDLKTTSGGLRVGHGFLLTVLSESDLMVAVARHHLERVCSYVTMEDS